MSLKFAKTAFGLLARVPPEFSRRALSVLHVLLRCRRICLLGE